MFSQYFGHYLLNEGLLTPDELNNALELQKTTHVKLGVLAANEGFMTSSQIIDVHEKQTQMDKRFGEIAIELGYLTEEQLETLLSSQKQQHLFLGQALVDANIMSIEQFTNALVAYKQSNSLTDDQFEAIKNGDIETLIENSIGLEDNENKQMFIDYISLFAKNMIRFIDDQIRIEASPVNGDLNAEWFVYQEISGSPSLFTSIAAKEDVFLRIASIYAEETLEEVDELAQASVSEFLNLHNGIFLVNMSNQGIELDMTPQQVDQNVSVEHINGYVVTIHTSNGSFDILISDQPKNISIKQQNISISN